MIVPKLELPCPEMSLKVSTCLEQFTIAARRIIHIITVLEPKMQHRVLEGVVSCKIIPAVDLPSLMAHLMAHHRRDRRDRKRLQAPLCDSDSSKSMLHPFRIPNIWVEITHMSTGQISVPEDPLEDPPEADPPEADIWP